MSTKPLRPLMILLALSLAACAGDMRTLLSRDVSRREAIETLIGDPAMRGQVIDRLLVAPDDRAALFEKIVEDEEFAGNMIQLMMRSEHCQAQLASRISSDPQITRAFMGKLMLTGTVGELMTQPQAEGLGLGEVFAHGNQMRTMEDLKRLGVVVDGWARENHGSYPVCRRFDAASGCLASLLPRDAIADLRLIDAWGRPFLYQSDLEGKRYALISYATDGLSDDLGRVGPTSSYNSDIVYSNGDFVQWPGRISKDAIR